MDQKELIDRITREVMLRLQETGPGTVQKTAEQPAGTLSLQPRELSRYIDHTLLHPDAVDSQFETLCKEAVDNDFYSVCVNSFRVPFVAKLLRGTNVKVCSVVGFPLGAMDSRSKGFEASHAVAEGANEIDMVLNIGATKEKNFKAIEQDIRSVRRACRGNTVLKVIIETCLLTDEEKVIVCQIAKNAEADFVKTSTGFSKAGATAHDVALMRKAVGPKMGVKASGGVRTYEDALKMIQAGATRLGTSSSVAIVQGGAGQSSY